ncbi:hypothetical protein GGI19_003665 [Coemansia pectinata]|uniref:Uncharacterized protein n=1 Tax=Coemansia pectinata TaxID=1052879 RepID=A0A9W8LAQ7_9FUNG|nr:hypothetical protein GGI19_003665 [Coemansia pectinata]
MPRRRHHHRRLEWSRSMESMVTLVDSSLATIALAATGASVSAEARPGLLRNTANGVVSNSPLDAASTNQVGQLSVIADNALSAPQSALVVRSQSEQTTTSVTSSSEGRSAKMQMGFGQRVRESLKRRLRSVGHAIMLTHFHESTQGIDGYYAVSMA